MKQKRKKLHTPYTKQNAVCLVSVLDSTASPSPEKSPDQVERNQKSARSEEKNLDNTLNASEREGIFFVSINFHSV